MKKSLFLVAVLSMHCLQGLAQSEPLTGSVYNYFGGAFQNFWKQISPELLAEDNGSYAYSKSLSAGRQQLLISLEGFGFSIPAGSTINSIIVRVKRFKQGKGSYRGLFVTLVNGPQPSTSTSHYGVRFPDTSPFPVVETEVLFTQSGKGNNGGSQGNQSYEWTPEMINHPDFGVFIAAGTLSGGSVVVYYDLVDITVNFTSPTPTRTSRAATRTSVLQAPVVYPNPFTTKANIQFTAVETGTAAVELYNILGAKVRTLFSGNVVQGQEYNVAAGEAQLPKGMYIYRITNGKQTYTGRINKVE